MELQWLPQRLACLRLEPGSVIPEWVYGSRFFSITRTEEEVSIFCDSERMEDVEGKIDGWRAFRVAGQLDLQLTGILSALAMPLAAKQIPVFSISTHDTDYMLMRSEYVEEARDVLRRAGHHFEGNP